MDILLTFAGIRDPFNPEAVQGSFTDGPVLTLLNEKQFQLTGVSNVKRISNFKPFAGPVNIPIKPITLIFSANSSGKSTIVQSLLM